MAQNDRLAGLILSAAIKAPCRAATTAAITLSGEQTIDGIACVTGDRVLVKDQADAGDNGIYDVDTGEWTRAPDFDGPYDVLQGTLVRVTSGSTLADSFWAVSTEDPSIDSTDIDFTQSNNALLGVSAFVQTLLDDASASAFLTTLGVSTYLQTLLDDATAAAARATLLVGPPFRNRIYNGAWRFDLANEGALYTVNAADVPAVDGWSGDTVGAGVFKLRRLADPDFPSLNVLEITCTTADAAIAAGDAYSIYHRIEGLDAADLLSGTASAKQITISFDMKFSVAGTYGVRLANSALNRYYIGTVTQAVANTRESKTVTLTLDTSGTWLSDNQTGIELRLTLAAGTNFQGAAGAWAAGNLYTTSGQANFMSANTNIGYLGRIQLEQGAVATPFEELSYAQDLQRTNRYAEKSYNLGTALANALDEPGSVRITDPVAAGTLAVPFKVPKRAAPTMSGYSTETGTVAKYFDDTSNADFDLTTTAAGNHGFRANFATHGAADEIVMFHWYATARLS